MGDVGAAPDEFEKELRRAVPDVLRLAKAGAVPGIGTETLRQRAQDIVVGPRLCVGVNHACADLQVGMAAGEV